MTAFDEDPTYLPEFFPGDEVGSYTVDELISEESGDVYRAHHSQSRNLVALKVVTCAVAQDLPDLAAVSGIRHLVETYEVGMCERHRIGFIAMRFVVGRKLGDFLDDWVATHRRPDSGQRRQLVERCAEVAGALAELHRRGHVHRDVKPQNVLIEAAGADALGGSAVLVDLGIAHPAGAPSAVSTLVYTLPYAAPEQHLGHHVDGRTDVFSLGVTMHDLLLGRSHSQRSRRQTMGLELLSDLAPQIDADLAAIVAECTEPNPDRRYRSAEELLADLRLWLAGHGVSVRPRSLVRRYGRLLRREPRRALHLTAMAGTIAALLILAVMWAWNAIDRATLTADLASAIEQGDLGAAVKLIRDRDDATGLVAAATADSCVARVLEHVVAEDGGAARRLAAQFVSRDGLAAHPIFDRWFARLLASGDSVVQGETCQLLARAVGFKVVVA